MHPFNEKFERFNHLMCETTEYVKEFVYRGIEEYIDQHLTKNGETIPKIEKGDRIFENTTLTIKCVENLMYFVVKYEGDDIDPNKNNGLHKIILNSVNNGLKEDCFNKNFPYAADWGDGIFININDIILDIDKKIENEK